MTSETSNIESDVNIKSFKSANDFSMYIENYAASANLSYVEAIISFCDRHLIDPEEIAGKINKSLRDKIEHDFRDLNYLPKQPQLDL